MRFTRKQLAELTKIIDRYTAFFIGTEIGQDFLTEADKKNLRSVGLDVDTLKPTFLLENAFRFGILSEALGHKRAKGLNYEQFKEFVASGGFIPLTKIELNALEHVKRRAFNDIQGLGNRMNKDATEILIEADRRQRLNTQKMIKDATERAIAERKDARWLATQMRDKTKDYARDFHRIADYLMHEAFDHGRAQQILKEKGIDAEVYKDVYIGACTTCQKLYTTAGVGSEPIIYKLRELLDNGNNIGRKAKELKPVLGPTHPYCRCTIRLKPDSSTWSQEKQTFVIGDNSHKFSDRIRNRKSKTKFTITND